MADPFVAEIRIFGFNFAPTGWAFCNGQLMPISQNTALFALLVTMYGGDGKYTFALPNLQNSAPMHSGQGPGLSIRDQGEIGGSSAVTLLTSEIPVHTHTAVATNSEADQTSPQDHVWAQAVSDHGAFPYYRNTGPNPMNPLALAVAGSGLPHNNMHPYLTLNFCIALQGVFPPRS